MGSKREVNFSIAAAIEGERGRFGVAELAVVVAMESAAGAATVAFATDFVAAQEANASSIATASDSAADFVLAAELVKKLKAAHLAN